MQDQRYVETLIKFSLKQGKELTFFLKIISNCNLASKGSLHLTFVDENYVPLALNWVASLKKLEIDNYLIVSMDENAAKFLSLKGCLDDIFNIDGRNHNYFLFNFFLISF